MASEDPTSMFADMKKKKKKTKVAFAEGVDADADPTFPPKEPIDDPALGPATAHERVQTSEAAGAADDGAEGANMFGDLKKKKKKKDLGAELDADATAADAGADALDFGDLKKKKKKKEIVETEDAAPAGDAAPLDDFSDLKKKKKKKDIPMDLEDPAGAAPADDFSDLKKKKKKKDIPLDLDGGADGTPAEGGEEKKKKKKKNLAMEEFEKEFGDAPDAAPVKPKKKKAVEESDDEAGGDDDEEGEFDDVGVIDEEELGDNPFANSGGRGDADEPWLDSDRDYTYEELLSRFFRLLHAQNPSLASSSSKRYTLAPPSIHRDGNKKSVFANIGDICRRMHREPAHVISFLLVEMGTTGSVDGSGRLVIKGKFQQKQIENILRRYIVEYVTCKTCKSPDTLLTKETRISFITCESCGSRQSVSAIKAGFQAQVGKRKKQQV